MKKEIKTVENQKIIKLVKAKTDKDNIYSIVNNECAFKATQELTYNEFKIYLYMILNQSGYEFALSTKDIAKTTGANQRKIQDAVNGLIEKGYLVLDKGNRYTFYESLICKKDIEIIHNNTDENENNLLDDEKEKEQKQPTRQNYDDDLFKQQQQITINLILV